MTDKRQSDALRLAAQQPGVAYAALPEPITYQIAVLKACEHGDALVGWRVEPSRQSFDASMRPKRKLYTEGDMHDFADRTHALRASHGQAPAQAAPAAVEGPVAVLKFERGTPGRQNEMPRVVSCNWMPDGEYEVYLAAAPTTQPSPAAQGDAELGRTAMRFVDRAGDVHPGIDDAETICAEFYKAMSDVIEKMPHVQRMQPSMSAPASQEGKSHDN